MEQMMSWMMEMISERIQTTQVQHIKAPEMMEQMMPQIDYQCKMISQMTEQMMLRMDYQCKMMSRMTDQLEMISEKMQALEELGKKTNARNMDWGTPKQSQKWMGTLTNQTQIVYRHCPCSGNNVG